MPSFPPIWRARDRRTLAAANRIAYIHPMIRPILALIFVALTALSAGAAPLPLSALSAYLNSLSTVQASFTQDNADGTQSSGTLIIQRPGRMRLEYAKPDKTLVIVGGGTVAIFDAKSNQPPEQYPLSRTPLNLILARNIDLSATKMVVGEQEIKGLTHVLAQDPKHPDYGTIELIFTPDPIALAGWIVTDQMGSETTVHLGKITPIAPPPAADFSVTVEEMRRHM